MSTDKLIPFDEMFDGWPNGAPRTGPELVNIEFNDLRTALERAGVAPEDAQQVYNLRAHGVEILKSAPLEPALTSPMVVATMLGTHLRPPKDKWITYPLDATRHRVSAPHKHSGSRYLCDIDVIVPEAKELTPLSRGGAYLLVRNDTIEILEHPGVLGRIASLARNAPLVDVIIWDTTNVESPTTYSLRRYRGGKGLESVEITIAPDLERQARTLWPS